MQDRDGRAGRDSLIRHLAEAGCPACRGGTFAAGRYLTSFIYEHHNDWRTLERLRSSLGFCDAHARFLLRHPDARYVMPGVWAEIIAAGLEWLGRAGRRSGRPAPCPACQSRCDSERLLMRSLAAAVRDPAVRAAYDGGGGLCLRHVREALRACGADETMVLLETARSGLNSLNGGARTMEVLCGPDEDAPARGDARARLAAVPPWGEGKEALAGLRARLGIASCPSCRAGALMELRYLTWLASESRSPGSSLAHEGRWLCPRHLHDLVGTDQEVAACIAACQRSQCASDVARSLLAVAGLPAAGWGSRLRTAVSGLARRDDRGVSWWARARRATRALVRRRRSALALGVAPVVRERWCDACRAVADAEGRELDLIRVALLDRATVARYEASHGLCLRHVLALPEEVGWGVPRRVLEARLRALAWELDNACRKASWSVRYEARGGEATAWLRAPAQLDGRVFLGAPASIHAGTR
jgi:hypothetical protein